VGPRTGLDRCRISRLHRDCTFKIISEKSEVKKALCLDINVIRVITNTGIRIRIKVAIRDRPIFTISNNKSRDCSRIRSYDLPTPSSARQNVS